MTDLVDARDDQDKPARLTREEIGFAGRTGFVELALEHNIPIVPVVAIGGQETALFLGRGRRLASALQLNRLLRLKVLPLAIGPPFGLTVLDLSGRIPLAVEDHHPRARSDRPPRPARPRSRPRADLPPIVGERAVGEVGDACTQGGDRLGR